MASRGKLVVLLVLGLTGVAVSACGDKHAWYRIDDYPKISLSPIVDFGDPSVAVEYSLTGAPPRMSEFNEQLQVGCSYCHVSGDPRTCDLTAEGTTSRLMMDLSDRFKVNCAFCHVDSPSKFNAKGKYAQRDMRLNERRWRCAACHDVGFKVTRTRLPD